MRRITLTVCSELTDPALDGAGAATYCKFYYRVPETFQAITFGAVKLLYVAVVPVFGKVLR